MRQSIGAALDDLGAPEEHADDRDRRNDQPDQEHGFAREDARQPAGQAGDRQDAGRQREPAEHLHHAELGAHVVFGARIARRIGARDHLGRHRVGDHVLDHGADHDQHGAEHVQSWSGRRKASQPPAAPASVTGRSRCSRADQDIGAALRAEDRHAVDQLAEHHLHGPRQAQPDADAGEFARASASGAP